ncbi:MAG: hypothetical protein EON85_10030 [Brevundimonas sp.]|nr:MAG: hypothetical protein EON85_10030 [Brevundimonas sp.]
MAEAKPKRPITGAKAFGVIMGLSLVAGAVAGLGGILVSEIPGVAGFGAALLINGLAMTAAMVMCIWWWRRIDEAAREAHKWAWWWGGCSGMAVGGTLLLTVLLREGETDLSGLAVNEVFAGGMALMLGFLIVGYTIAWAVWWARRR